MENNFIYTDESITEFLLSLSDDILIKNIEEQIKNPTDETENYYEFIINKLDSVETVLAEDPELKSRVNEFKEDIYLQVKKLIEEKFSIILDLEAYSNKSKCLLAIYEFFIMRKSVLLENLVKRYIKDEYNSLVLTYSKNNKLNKKDLTYTNNKKELEKEDIVILMNLHSIIDSFNVSSVEDLLEMMINDKDEFTYNFILELNGNDELLFNQEFIDIIMSEIKKERNNLIMKLRISILEKNL